MVSGFYFLRDLLPILFVPEVSSSFMGGSDVVHCVRVPLTGTTVAEFWAYGTLVWVGFCTFTYSVDNIVDIEWPLYYCCAMGPRLGDVAKSICLIIWLIM